MCTAQQVVKVIWHKTASPQHTGATWRIRLNLCFLRPTPSTTKTANRSVKSLLHSLRQKVSVLYNGRPFPPKLPLSMERSEPPSNSWFLGPVRANNPNGITIGSAVFAQVTAECPYTLQWAPLFPKLVLRMGDLDPRGQSEPTTQMASRSVQPFLHGSLVWQTILLGG